MSRLQFNPSFPLVFVDKQNNRMLQHSALKSVGVNLCLGSVILVCVVPTYQSHNTIEPKSQNSTHKDKHFICKIHECSSHKKNRAN